MYTIKEVLCEDGLVRRVRLVPERSQKKKKEIIPKELEEFAALYKEIARRYFAEEMYFQSKSWTRKKILYVIKALSQLKRYNIRDKELYLLAQFETHKYCKKSIWPSTISSHRGIENYRQWISQFPSKREARKLLQNPSLEELLSINHKRFLWYVSTGWTKKEVYSLKSEEFDPVYLVSDPDFMRLFNSNPEVFSKKRFELEKTFYLVNRDYMRRREFMDVARRAKCQM